MHAKIRSTGFLVEPQNQGQRFVSGLASKPLGRFSPDWPQNRWCGFFQFGLKTGGSGFLVWASKPAGKFGDLDLKIIATVSWFGHQNHPGYGLLVAPQNRREGNSVGHVLRFSGLRLMEASHARVFQSSLKTGGCTIACGARGTITELCRG
jgi:hypothetical protein